MKLKIFTQPDCPKCPAAKEFGKEMKEKLEVEMFDTSTPDGLAESQYFAVMATPTIVLTDKEDNELQSWRGKVPTKKEIEDLMK